MRTQSTYHATSKHMCKHDTLMLLTFLNNAHFPICVLWSFKFHTHINVPKCSYSLWSRWVEDVWNRPEVVEKRTGQRIWHFCVVLSSDNYKLVRGRGNLDNGVHPGILNCFPRELISSFVKENDRSFRSKRCLGGQTITSTIHLLFKCLYSSSQGINT